MHDIIGAVPGRLRGSCCLAAAWVCACSDGGLRTPSHAPLADAGSVDVHVGTAMTFEEGVPLPFAVDDLFAPSGFMGDGERAPDAVLASTTDCSLPRPLGAQGECYRFTYTPLQPATPGALAWAGVYWQHPDNNWGSVPGLAIEPGATEVTFLARADREGVAVQFFAGGIGARTATPLPYRDDFEARRTLVLSKEMQQFTLPLAREEYEQVLGGFGWSIELSYPSPAVTIYLDDIRWR